MKSTDISLDRQASSASAPLFLRNGELLGHSPIRNVVTLSDIYHAGYT